MNRLVFARYAFAFAICSLLIASYTLYRKTTERSSELPEPPAIKSDEPVTKVETPSVPSETTTAQPSKVSTGATSAQIQAQIHQLLEAYKELEDWSHPEQLEGEWFFANLTREAYEAFPYKSKRQGRGAYDPTHLPIFQFEVAEDAKVYPVFLDQKDFLDAKYPPPQQGVDHSPPK